MSLWSRISDALAALANGEGLSAVFDKLRTPPERTVGFTIAVIALSAKMAKADGHVTRAEVMAFREVFHIPARDEDNAARVFNLARQDVAGFEHYAAQIKSMFRQDSKTLEDLLEGLFHVATADGHYHENEDAFLRRVADTFGIGERCFRVMRSRFVKDAPCDPYDVLGVDPDMSFDDIRAAWRQLVRETHPDSMMARGVPEEAIKLAQSRMVAINQAWDDINRARA
ncbi:MAG: TerB family tellurite resistance protein [Planktomarina sp.]